MAAKSGLSKLASDAQREPLNVLGPDFPEIVVMSKADYDRLLGQARSDLIEHMHKMRESAASRGMTPEILGELLADDD